MKYSKYSGDDFKYAEGVCKLHAGTALSHIRYMSVLGFGGLPGSLH